MYQILSLGIKKRHLKKKDCVDNLHFEFLWKIEREKKSFTEGGQTVNGLPFQATPFWMQAPSFFQKF